MERRPAAGRCTHVIRLAPSVRSARGSPALVVIALRAPPSQHGSGHRAIMLLGPPGLRFDDEADVLEHMTQAPAPR